MWIATGVIELPESTTSRDLSHVVRQFSTSGIDQPGWEIAVPGVSFKRKFPVPLLDRIRTSSRQVLLSPSHVGTATVHVSLATMNRVRITGEVSGVWRIALAAVFPSLFGAAGIRGITLGFLHNRMPGPGWMGLQWILLGLLTLLLLALLGVGLALLLWMTRQMMGTRATVELIHHHLTARLLSERAAPAIPQD